MNQQFDAIWVNGNLATCQAGYGFIENAGIAVKAGKIAWVGAMDTLSETPDQLAPVVHDLNGRCLTPGLIDCHTHLVYAGQRAHEFEQRLQGVSYETIARQGGGIQSTVKATRAATEEELFQQSMRRAKSLQASGVTTVEIKSGYGLNWESELKILRVIKRIEESLPLTVKKTFLGAHTIPIEFQGESDAYVDLICQQMLPAIAQNQLADAVDVFCEKIAFSLAQTERIFKAASALGLAIKCHAEQLSDSGSAAIAAKYHALSVDHLEHVTEAGISALAHSGTVAVLLPGAFYYLRETKLPPIELLRKHKVPMAIATDCNPGTAPIASLQMMLNMACTLFQLTPMEALTGVTRHAAQALGLGATHGSLTPGKMADFAIWDVQHPCELSYYMGQNLISSIVKNGSLINI